MTRWTDEPLVALLTDTFAAHERDADPAVARRIALSASPAARMRWPLGAAVAAVAAIVVVVAGLTVHSVPAPQPERLPAAASTPTATREGRNRALAAAEAARVLASIPVPPGARRSESAPVRRLRHLGLFNEPMDPSLTRTNWWVVPLAYRNLVSWYRSHAPADLNFGSAYAGPSSSSLQPRGDLYWELSVQSPSYSTPTAVVSYARLGPDTTAIRIDATLAARYDRTAATLVPSTVTSIDITRSAIDGPSQTPTTARVTDPRLVTRVTSAFNNLDGAMAHVAMACGSPVGIVHAYGVTFHWPGHTLAVDPGSPLCGIGMGLTRDGTRLPQTLDDDGTLASALEAALDARTSRGRPT